jgi:predicted pyridoxine 5'-phosphate oxidase superfamily flavin-nucleotide-binding protein
MIAHCGEHSAAPAGSRWGTCNFPCNFCRAGEATSAGPAGFLKILDDRTVAFAVYVGNRQYITVGNLIENNRVVLFLIDYERGRRLKIWVAQRLSTTTLLSSPACATLTIRPRSSG